MGGCLTFQFNGTIVVSPGESIPLGQQRVEWWEQEEKNLLVVVRGKCEWYHSHFYPSLSGNSFSCREWSN